MLKPQRHKGTAFFTELFSVNLRVFSFFLCVMISGSAVVAQQTQTTTTTTNPQQTQQQQQGYPQGQQQQNTNTTTLPANVQPTPQQQQQLQQQFPSGFNLDNIDPKDIPDEGMLRSFGLSEEQIKYALEKKRNAQKKGRSAVVVNPDTTNKSILLGQRPKDKVVPVASTLIDSFGLIKTYPKGLIH